MQNIDPQPFREPRTNYTKQHPNNSTFDPLQHQQRVWTKPILQRYLLLHMIMEEYNPPADEQPSSIWEVTYQNHSTPNRDTSNSEVLTLGVSIGITDKSKNNNSI